jgi:multidrug efflux pump subunit AcrA (membrane-fusion protein)
MGIKDMRKKIFYYVLILFFTLLCSCETKKQQQQQTQIQTVTAVLKETPTQLFYSGTVSPIQVFNVISPTDGTIQEIFFKYGQKVNVGDKLLVVTSAKLQDDYRTAFTNFIKAKEDYTNAKINFQGTLELKKANIISEQEYLSEKDQYDETTLGYINARIALEQIIAKIPGLTIDLEKLSPDDVASLNRLLQTQYSNLTIIAKNSGVVLSPQKQAGTDGGGSDGGGDSDSSKTLQIGAQVKEGQTLVSLGDLTGINTTVAVSELAINKIKPGQAVIVTLDALPDIQLKGSVKTVGAQAQSAEGGQAGIATFPVTVVVPTLTPSQAQLIRVGMTTKIQITIENPPQIMIPIAAVYQKNGNSFVKVRDAKTNQIREVSVTTGQTTETDVAITGGLKAGDQVVLP